MNNYLRHAFVVLSFISACIAQSVQVPATPRRIMEAANPVVVTSEHSAVSASPTAANETLGQLKQAIDDERAEQRQRLEDLQQEEQQLVQTLQKTQEKLASNEEQIKHLQTEQSSQITKLESELADVKATLSATSNDLQIEKKHQVDLEQPTSLHYRGITITPGGFFAAETLYRAHAENAEIGTTWNSIPFGAQSMAHLSEFRATSRQTRLSLNVAGTAGMAKLTGYFETDFLGTGSGASEVQTNGFSNRIRQLWGRVMLPGGWTFAGGQMWSLITTNRLGIDNLTEFTTPLIDASQFIGHDYARQTAFRVTKTFDNNKETVAFSVENPAAVAVVPGNVPASVSGLISGLSTTGTGVLSNTTYSTNLAPDLIAKFAFEPGFGHYEIKAIGRFFRDRLDSTPAVAATKTAPAIAATPGRNSTVLGGGIGAAAYLPVVRRKVDFIAEGMWGNIGRYGATGTDLVVKPDGLLSTEKSIHGMTGFETHPLLRLDWYVFGADEYLYRNYGYGLASIDNTKCFVEATVSTYSCSASVKSLAGATTGIWYRFYKGNYGTVQSGLEYTYVYKDTWSGKGGAPRGIDNMLDTSFRYYLP